MKVTPANRNRSMPSVSGLSEDHRRHARMRILQGASLMLSHPNACHYTMGARRWDGIDRGLLVREGRFPFYSDCSSSATWLIWNAIHVSYGCRDTVNDLGWRAGYTGTACQGGRTVEHDKNLMVGDFIFYGNGPPYHHVAVYIGGGYIFSHGSEAGPHKTVLDYRGDRGISKRYI